MKAPKNLFFFVPVTVNPPEGSAAGQKFKLPPKRRQQELRRFYHVKEGNTVVEQIGGEEVLVSLPSKRFPELFGIEVA